MAISHQLLLDMDVLRSFVAISETGSFSGAARAVLRTPSAISMQIKKLEEQLGRQLFVREGRRVSLTADGGLECCALGLFSLYPSLISMRLKVFAEVYLTPRFFMDSAWAENLEWNLLSSS